MSVHLYLSLSFHGRCLLFTWEMYLLCYLCVAVPYFHEVQSNFILVIVWKC